jgi:hypothetical protein
VKDLSRFFLFLLSHIPQVLGSCNIFRNVRGPFKRFVDLRQCAAVMQREAVNVVPSCGGGGKVVVA